MNPIDFEGQRSKVKVTMDMYGNKLVNRIATKPLSASWSNLADMLAMVREWTLLILEVKGQGHNGHIYGDKLLNTIETNQVCISSSNLAEMLTMVRLWTLLILEVKGQGHSGHIWKWAVNQIQTKPLCAFSSNLADMLTMVNPIDFGGHSSKVKVTMVKIDKCGVRGDATLSVVIFFNKLVYRHPPEKKAGRRLRKKPLRLQ